MHQVVAPSVIDYLAAHHQPLEPVLAAIRDEGLALGLPLADEATARFLRALVIALPARRILEIGTAIGYSAACMALAQPAGGTLITMEVDAGRASAARQNFARAGVESRVSVIVGNASRFLHKVAGPFDLVFQDGSKQLYEPLLDRLIGHLRPGGVLVTDNVLWHGEVVPGLVATPGRDPRDTEAIARHNRTLASDSRVLTTFLPLGDGVAFSVKLP